MANNIINKIRNGFKKQEMRRLTENFVSLSLLQVINYVLPLVTLPYLVRVLGVDKFGLVMFANSFILYFLMLADYGFNLSATREISMHRDNEDKVSEIFSSVMIIKGMLVIVSLGIMTLIVFGFGRFRKDWLVYFFTFGIIIGQSLFPIWFFQGMERMKYITFLNITAKTIFTILIFIFGLNLIIILLLLYESVGILSIENFFSIVISDEKSLIAFSVIFEEDAP